MNGDIWWGVSLSFRMCRGVYLHFSGPALLIALGMAAVGALCYLPIWATIILPINIIMHHRRRRGRTRRV